MGVVWSAPTGRVEVSDWAETIMNTLQTLLVRTIAAALVLTASAIQASQTRTVAEERSACRAALSENSVSWVESRLDQVKLALQQGDIEAASKALHQARLFPRTADVSVAPRCLGAETYRRMFELGNRLAETHADAAIAAGNRFNGRNSAIALLIQARAADRVEALLEAIPDDTGTANYVFNLLDSQLDRSASAGVGGQLPPYEFEGTDAWQSSVRSLRDRLLDVVGSRVTDILAAEAEHWNAPLSELETQHSASVDQSSGMLAAMAGEEQADELLPQGKRPKEFYRASRSIDMIGRALGYADASNRAPVAARAAERANRFYELARDEDVVITMRDGLFQYAERLYDFANRPATRREVQAARERFQPELQTAIEEREKAAKAFATKMREQLPSEPEIRAAEEAMRKSESEQASFREEADALEEELGF